MPRADGHSALAESLTFLDSPKENPLRATLGALRAEAVAARDSGACGAAFRWICVVVLHSLAGLGLVLAMRTLYFGGAGAECRGAVLISCEDDESWEWSLGSHDELHDHCSSFSATRNHSLHEFCAIAKDREGVLAEDACKAACSSCGWSLFFEIFLAGAPIWARNALISTVLISSCARLSGFQRTGLCINLLVGVRADNSDDDGTDRKSGWNAIVGQRVGDAGPQRQSTWLEACQARGLTHQQALASALTKLLLWHWSQPVAYLLVLWGYRCYVAALGPGQSDLAAVVAARETVYLASTLLGAWQCPVFLLMDPAEAWNEADSKLEKSVRVATYLLTPHNYTAFCLANRFRGWRRTFLGLAGIQVLADLASCVALAALMAGGIEEETKKPPAALKIGYIITAFGFLMFFGPLSVAGSLSGAFDKRKHWCRRMTSAVGGTIVLCGWTFIAHCAVRVDLHRCYVHLADS